MNGSVTGSRNGIARIAQKTSRPCSPTSASSSRKVTSMAADFAVRCRQRLGKADFGIAELYGGHGCLV